MKGIYKRFTAIFLACLITASTGFTAAGEVSNNIAKEKPGVPFDNYEPERDTNGIGSEKKYENSQAGLHTDKTVIKAYDDGRTFDLNLEAWRIGTNTADVSFILDASGSMAWVSENISPMSVGAEYSKANADDLYDGFFLKDDVLDKFLNPANTDNTSLSYSDYQYYVYDPRSSVQEYVPLGFWEGGDYDIINNNPINVLENTWSGRGYKLMGYYPIQSGSNSTNQINKDSGEPGLSIINSPSGNVYTDNGAHDGYYGTTGTGKLRTGDTTDRAMNMVSVAEGNENFGGVLLDVKPESGSAITISFSLYINSGSANGTYDNTLTDTDVFLIAPLGVDYKNDNHFRFTLSDKPRLWGNGNSLGSSFENEIKMKTTNFITVVIDPSKPNPDNVIVYINGTERKAGNNKGFSDSQLLIDNPRIIFGPGNTTASAPYIIDEIYVFDGALTKADEANLRQEATKQSVSGGTVAVKKTDGSYRDQTDRAYAGSTVISQLQADYESSTRSRGWYYVNSSGTWPNLENTRTGKQYVGLLTDTQANVKIGEVQNPSGKNITDKGPFPTQEQIALKDNNGHEALRFYVDEEGLLRCLVNSGQNSSSDTRTFISYVYQNEPHSMIKVEMLEAALNSFTNQLFTRSPQSRISAVRFSSENVTKGKNTFEQLQLLPWTTGEKVSANTFDLVKKDGNYSAEKGYYPYTLTGGTAAWTGLESYMKYLAPEAGRKVGEKYSKKYIILFTDGKDDTWNNTGNVIGKGYAEDYAAKLKDAANTRTVTSKHDSSKYTIKAYDDDKDGYTIFTVMLEGGTASRREEAQDFLGKIAGEATKNPEIDHYDFYANNMETLENAFDEILSLINKDLEDYVVQDYIDPRFDLVDADGNVIELKNGGNIGVAKVNMENGFEFVCERKEEADENDKKQMRENKVKLYYDGDADMYFLKWTGCKIPMTVAPNKAINGGKNQISVWSSNITIKAKEDFIGGNAVLTNGNKPGMNLVYSSKDKRPLSNLSGTKYMAETSDNPYPAKGFPRTTVNVRLKSIKTEEFEDVVYLGEVISPAEMLTDIEKKFMEDSYYLEYLRRYANRLGDGLSGNVGASNHEQLISLLNAWLKIDKKEDDKSVKSFTIPYMYLPSVDEAGNKLNNTGDALTHEMDILGILTYEWEKLDPPDNKNDNPEDWYYTAKTDPYVSNKTDQIKYSLTVRYTPLTLSGNFNDQNIVERRGEYKFLEKDIFFDTDFTVIAGASSWKFGTRNDYNMSMLKGDNYYYTWYKKPVGEKQLDVNQDYKIGNSNVEKRDYFVDEEKGDDTLRAETPYTKNIVSGGLAFEIRVPVGDLKKVLNSSGGYERYFTVNAKRKFNHADDQKKIDDNKLGDYGETFTLTYSINYSAAQIKALIGSKKDKDYVSLFATVNKANANSQGYISASFNGVGNASKTQLPIGTYTIDLSSVRDLVFVPGNTNTKFNKIYGDGNAANYTADRFTDDVYDNDTGKSIDNKPHHSQWEIDEDLTKTNAKKNRVIESKYIADYENSKGLQSVSFYLGTGTDDKKGNTASTSDSYYINDRLGIICLSYGQGSLELTKNVKNSDKYNDIKWTFYVTLYSDVKLDTRNFDAEYKDADGKIIQRDKPILEEQLLNASDGSYMYKVIVKLQHGETIRFSNFQAKDTSYTSEPKIRYEIREGTPTAVLSVDYDVEYDPGDSGIIDVETKVVCNNIFPESFKLPGLGGIGTRGIVMFGAGTVLLSILLFGMYYRKRIMRTQKDS